KMPTKQRSALCVRRAGECPLLPIPREPVKDQIVVNLRRLAAQHQINLERLVDEAWIVNVLLDLLFEGQDEPRPQEPFESLAVEIVRGVLKARALAEAKGLFNRRRIVALGVADRQIRQRTDQLVDGQETGIGDRILLDEGSGDRSVVIHALLACGNERGVATVAHPPQAENARGGEADQSESRGSE